MFPKTIIVKAFFLDRRILYTPITRHTHNISNRENLYKWYNDKNDQTYMAAEVLNVIYIIFFYISCQTN